MDFRFTQDQQDLIDAAKAVFDGENTVERMRAMVAGEEVEDLFQTFSDLGLFGVLIPEKEYGLGQPLVVMAAIAEAAGYSGLPEPYVSLAGICVPLLRQMKEKTEVEYITYGQSAPAVVSPLQKQTSFGGRYIFTKRKGGRIVKREEATDKPMKSIDPLRGLYSVDGKSEDNAMVNHHGAVLTAAQLVGLSQRMVDMSVDYAKDRHQFGKPIGAFQAIKHQLANVYTQIEFTRPMVHLAAIKGRRAVHTAKVAAIDTAMLAAETAIQVHGGMGYTFEVDLHLFMKRAWALCGEWGDRNYHMKKLEDMVLDGDEPLGAGQTF